MEFKILRVDLSNQRYSTSIIPEEILKQTIGGKGLASYLLLQEIPPKIDGLDPKNKLIFVSGPVTGTIFPTGNRYGILYKSPLTGTYAESYSGGGLAQKLRASGYDVVIIEGKSKDHRYLYISEDSVEFRDANHLWGKDTFETYHELLKDNPKDVDVLSIGQAGENLLRIANIQNNLFHSAGRCGPGAIMGSKNLKAILFSGRKRPEINKSPKFRELVKEVLRLTHEKEDLYGKHGVYREYGTPIIVDWANELGCFPTKYFTAGYSDYYENFNALAINNKILKKRTGCWNCPFTCSKDVEVPDGPFKSAIEGPEYETIAVFAGLCDIHDIEPVVKINEFCDKVGIDTISAGNLVALAIEAKRRGLLSSDLKEFNELDYNKPLAVLAFLDKMVKRENIAKDFGEGTKFISEKYHLEKLAMHVKGLDFAGYDPRAFRGFAISYGVAPEGPTHLRSVYHGKERHLPDRLGYDNKVLPMLLEEDRMAIIDSLIVCKFLRGILDWPILTRIYNDIFNTNINEKELHKIAHIMITRSRIFNNREGFSRKDDYMPERAYKEKLKTPSGLEFGLDKNGYDKMLDEYYQLRGWDKDGYPPDNFKEIDPPYFENL